jgi:hypothetical protein
VDAKLGLEEFVNDAAAKVRAGEARSGVGR